MAGSGFVGRFAALVTASVVVPRGRSTAPLVESVEWTLREEAQCALALIIGEGTDEALQFDTEAGAKAECEASGAECFGIYDMQCSKSTFFLCSAEDLGSWEDLGFSETSCVQEMTIITATATTTTTTEPTTTAAAAATTAAAAATTAAEAAATTPAPAVGATTTGALPGAGAGDTSCDRACSLLGGDSELTCREQILSFKPPSEDTGSMPALEMTCENRRALVSAQGSCQECSGCDVCATTLADTRLWKASDDGGGRAEASGGAPPPPLLLSGGGRRGAAAALLAGLGGLVGALLAAAAVVQRRLLGWQHLREQTEGA